MTGGGAGPGSGAGAGLEPGPGQGAGAQARPREGWPDVVKGVCIILVVLWHVVVKHSAALPWSDAGSIPDLWRTISAQLLPLRMPLFFLVSGMFAAGVVLAPTRTRLAGRALRLALLYALWVIVQTFALAAAGPDFDTARATTPLELLRDLTISPTNLWYLLALAVYLVLGRVTRSVPTGILLPAAFLVSAVGASGVIPPSGNLWQVVQNVFFFFAGLRLRELVRRHAARSGWMPAALLTGAFALAFGAATLLGVRPWFGMWTLLSALAVAAGVSVCVLLDRVEVIAGPLRRIGRRTLPIYVIHMIPLALIDRLLRNVDDWVFAGPVFALLEVPLVVAIVIAASIGAHAVLTRVGGGFLFDPLLLRPRRRVSRVAGG